MNKENEEFQEEEFAHKDKKQKTTHESNVSSPFDKLPDEILLHMFSFLNLDKSSEEINKFRRRNILRITSKQFYQIEDYFYRDDIEALIGKEKSIEILKKNDNKTFRKIYEELEEKIFNYALDLDGRIKTWVDWDEYFIDGSNQEGYLQQIPFYYKLIANYFKQIAKDVGITSVLKYLLEQKSLKDPLSNEPLLRPFDINILIFNDTTLLEWVAGLGDLSAVRYLLAHGAIPTATGGLSSPLRSACWQSMDGKSYFDGRENPSYMQIIKELISAGADVHFPGYQGPLFLDIMEHPACTIEIIKLFLDKYDPANTNQNNPLFSILSHLSVPNLSAKGYENYIEAFNYIYISDNYEKWTTLLSIVDDEQSLIEECVATNKFLTDYKELKGEYPSQTEFAENFSVNILKNQNTL